MLYSDSARVDLLRLSETFLDRAVTGKGLESVEVAVNDTRDAVEQGLGYVVTVYLNAGYSSLPGALSILFGGAGYVALDEIKDAT